MLYAQRSQGVSIVLASASLGVRSHEGFSSQPCTTIIPSLRGKCKKQCAAIHKKAILRF
jgi:hypothetical protein